MHNNYIKDTLNKLYKGAKCTLVFNSTYELLVATMLSAQTTDEKVNKVTKELFKKYPSARDIAVAKEEDIYEYLKPLGLAKVKSKNLILLSEIIIEEYKGEVPCTKEELKKLPGVGEKVAEVVLAEGFAIPSFPVDTHVKRVSNRLGLVKETDPIKIEAKLKAIFDKKDWISLHHQLIAFGRDICKATKPECSRCPFQGQCTK